MIAPASVDGFVRDIWGQRTHHAAAALVESPPLLDIDTFEDHIARMSNAGNGWLHLARGSIEPLPAAMLDADGMVDLRRLRAAFAGGHTLYLTKVERLSPSLAHCAGSIAADLARAGLVLEREVSAHCFLTPPEAQGFALHRDAHASFIVQLEGNKDWLVYPPAPVDDHPGVPRRPGPVAPEALTGRTPERVRLAPGDVLFMPEWWPHTARAGGEASFHVTFRLFPLRWTRLLAELSETTGMLDGAVSPGVAAGKTLHAMLADAAVRDGIEDMLAAMLRRQRMPERTMAGHVLSQIARLDALAAETPLVRNIDAPCECLASGGRAHLLFPGGALCGPEAFLPVFEFVTRHRVLRPIDLPDLADAEYDRLDLARAMICEGLFSFARIA